MLPIAPLMLEHRLIERMLKAIKTEIDSMDRIGRAAAPLIEHLVDFFCTYAGRCHQGKEEDILFRSLSERQMSDQHKRTMSELVREHALAKDITDRLAAAEDRYFLNDRNARSEIKTAIDELINFYPPHFEKEDKHFFVPCIEYLSTHEQDDMLETFWEFDRMLLHEKYRTMVEQFEARK